MPETQRILADRGDTDASLNQERNTTDVLFGAEGGAQRVDEVVDERTSRVGGGSTFYFTLPAA